MDSPRGLALKDFLVADIAGLPLANDDLENDSLLDLPDHAQKIFLLLGESGLRGRFCLAEGTAKADRFLHPWRRAKRWLPFVDVKVVDSPEPHVSALLDQFLLALAKLLHVRQGGGWGESGHHGILQSHSLKYQ
jgi:hypothetical protein